MPHFVVKEVSTAIVLGIIGAACFYPSIDGQFVFDDAEAIINNNDLKLHTPFYKLFKHDFWGTPLIHNSSHKSYRPLTVLSFRFHIWWNNGRLVPFDFHLFNLFLHGIATALAYPVFGKLFELKHSWGSKAFLSALLFAVHPIHSETVAGIVGRADLLCSICSFLSFLLYCKATSATSYGKSIIFTMLSVTLAGVAMLCKEQGITIIGLCSSYDIFVVNQNHPMDVLPFIQFIKLYIFPERSRKVMHCQKSRLQFVAFLKKNQMMLVRHTLLLLTGGFLLFLRCWVMNFTQPIFREVDNPHSFAETFFERVLNYNYIYALNAWLLICPEWLCFDWSMGCIPLIKLDNIFKDMRFFFIFIFWLIFSLLIVTSLRRPTTSKQRDVLLALLCIVIPFSIASNLFVRVGFVIAERILYMPSIGYCMLIVIGMDQLTSYFRVKNIISTMLVFLLFINTLRCHQRSFDWRTEKQLFTKGLNVCPLNAKIHYNFAKTAENTEVAIKHYRQAIMLYPDYEQAMNNLANVLREDGQMSEAEQLLRKAISLRPDFAAAWMNLGIVLSTMKRYDEALECYNYALAYRRKYPDCFYNLGNLFLARQLYNEAFAAWKQATALKPTHSIAWNNMIVMLDSLGELDKAQSLATEALTILPDDSALHFNLANTLGKKGLYENAEYHFLKAIKLKKDQALYHTNLGVLYHRWKKYRQAEREYKVALSLNPEIKNVEQNLKTVRKFLAINNKM